MKKTTYLFALLSSLFFSSQAISSSPYSLNTANELIYLGAGTTLALTGYYNERDRAAPTISDLNNLNKNDIPSYERRFAGTWDENSHKLSDITLAAGVLSPLSLFFIDNDAQKADYFTLGVMYLETFLLTSGGMVLSKGSTTRYRPLAYGSDAPLSEKLKHDTKRSFFSGHASLATSGFVFSASVFSDYYPDSKYKAAVWSAAITGSVATGLLRLKAGKHFPTDIIVGWAWGGAVGYLIPSLHKKERDFVLFPFANDEQQGVKLVKLF